MLVFYNGVKRIKNIIIHWIFKKIKIKKIMPINPKTGRLVHVGTPTYEKLVERGVFKKSKRRSTSRRSHKKRRSTRRRSYKKRRSTRKSQKRYTRLTPRHQYYFPQRSPRLFEHVGIPARHGQSQMRYNRRIHAAVKRERGSRNRNRPSPTKSAAATPLGKVMTGNDGRLYRVTRRINGTQFWKAL